MPARLLVVGSINQDRVQRVRNLPQPGETMHGVGFNLYRGGKGANQAVAAARLGAMVRMAGCIGNDAAGDDLARGLQEAAVDTQHLKRLAGPTGFATILVADGGENVIVLEGGANQRFTPEHLDARAFDGVDAALFQLEVPLATVLHGLTLARAHGVKTVLNAAPPDHASEIPSNLVDVLVVNRQEATRMLGGRVSGAGSEALLAGLAHSYANVILTLGSDGMLWAHAGERGHRQAHRVRVVDTTGAGDTFTGAFATAWWGGASFTAALDVASAAAAVCVTRAGAQTSMPTLADIEKLGVTLAFDTAN